MSTKIGIIGAMKEEIDEFREAIQLKESKIVAGITYYVGELHNKSVVLCQSGVGKVNASICTQLLIDHFNIDKVIFTGVAGGVNPNLNIGDIVISTDCIQHDIDASPLGFKRGVIPFAEQSVFPADDQLVQLAVGYDPEDNIQVTTGRVLSGDQFIASKEEVKMLHEDFNGSCVEMEGAAVAQVCYLNKIPFVIIRSLSDKADGDAHVNFPEFVKLAAKRSHGIVNHIVQHID